MKIKRDGTIKKRVKQREDMFLRRLMGMLAEMAKADGDEGCVCRIVPNGDVLYGTMVMRERETRDEA